MIGEYHVIGTMSGTSLDGLDLCCSQFVLRENIVSFKILKCETVDIPSELREKLTLSDLRADELAKMDFDFGRFTGRAVARFKQDLVVEDILCVASHGHTIFHQPGEGGYTTQIGHGGAIAYYSGLKCVNDFRSSDVVKNGQGAPLVPIGDRDLFPDYETCVNLGGFANVSRQSDGQRIAFDICPVNFVLNRLSEKIGLPYDDDGQIAAKSIVDKSLLDKLNNLPFYTQNGPKSLGAEWVQDNVFPIIKGSGLTVEDSLATFTEHAAMQIAQNISGKTLMTGGGVYNGYLMKRIDELSGFQLELPDKEIIEYKEALIFAWLGLKRVLGQVNVLKTVTGAIEDSVGGAVYLP